MHDAEALETFDGLGREHRGAVVGEQRAWKSTLLEGLRQTVDERFGSFVEVPLKVATEARAIVEDAEKLGFDPLAARGEHGARALMKVEVPEPMHVRDLVRAHLARHERRLALTA